MCRPAYADSAALLTRLSPAPPRRTDPRSPSFSPVRGLRVRKLPRVQQAPLREVDEDLLRPRLQSSVDRRRSNVGVASHLELHDLTRRLVRDPHRDARGGWAPLRDVRAMLDQATVLGLRVPLLRRSRRQQRRIRQSVRRKSEIWLSSSSRLCSTIPTRRRRAPRS